MTIAHHQISGLSAFNNNNVCHIMCINMLAGLSLLPPFTVSDPILVYPIIERIKYVMGNSSSCNNRNVLPK